MKVVQGFKGCKDPISVCLQLERGKLNIIQIIFEIRFQREQSSSLKVFIAPCRILELGGTPGSVAATFVGERGSNWYV